MRFIIFADKIEYWTNRGEVSTIPLNKLWAVLRIVSYYKLTAQAFSDRLIFTEFIV